MNDAKLVNITRLMTTYNFVIEQLPDNLKCAQCKLVLKDACQVPCGCTYCRACINELMSTGSEFCPGGSEYCGESLLLRFQSHFGVNNSILRLTVKCPNDGCVHECRLTNIEKHLRECQRKDEKCPFRELGCMQDKLSAEEMDEHLLHENRKHSEILIGMIVNINREIDALKHVVVLKDGQIRSILDQMMQVQNENKSIKDDIKSIKEEKEDLAGQVRILTEKIERETAERRENDELDSARVIEHVDKEIAAVTGLIGSNKAELATEIQSVRNDSGSLNKEVKSIKEDILLVKPQVESIQALVGQGQVDAKFEWLIDVDVGKSSWTVRHSEHFTGEVQQFKYRLASWNVGVGTARAALCTQLHIYADPNGRQLAWPFDARVVITVTDRDRREACRSISRQCRIEKPPDKEYRGSEVFKFIHSELINAGLNLSRRVRVSCVIVLGVGQ